MDDVVDLGAGVIQRLLGLFGRGVGTDVLYSVSTPDHKVVEGDLGPLRTDIDGPLGDHGAVGLPDDAIGRLYEIVTVADDLIPGDLGHGSAFVSAQVILGIVVLS